MATTTIQRTLSDGTDMRAALSNSNFARKHNIPTGWTRCRLAARVQMNSNGAALASTPKFYMGLCNGTGNLYFDTTTTHFLGMVTNDDSWSWTHPNYTVSATTGSFIVHKTGTISTNSTGWQGTIIFNGLASGNAKVRKAILLDFERNIGTQTYFISGLSCNNTTSGDITSDEFYLQIALNSPTFTNHNKSAYITFTGIDESVNPLDHFTMGWDRVTPTIEVSDLAIVYFE